MPLAPQVAPSWDRPETSISLGAIGQLTSARINETSGGLVTESFSPSSGAAFTFRQSFKPWLGYSVNVGFSRATYRYVVAPSATFTGKTYEMLVPTNMFETSVSYIAQKHVTNRVTGFGEAGGGSIGFAATNGAGDFQRRSNAFLPAGIAGFGFDYRLAHGLGVRAEYRGLFVKYPFPDYSNSLRLNTFISEPSLSITYNFDKRTKR
jgi:hypothetical protein